MIEENSSATQENVEAELAVIESIFPSEFENLSEPGAQHLCIRLTIQPCDAKIALVKDSTYVRLKITTSAGYPAIPADYDVEWSEGLGKNEAEQMKEGLDKLRHQYAKEKKIMISDMGFYVRNFLTDHAALMVEEEKSQSETEEEGLARQNRFKEAEERALKILKEETRQRKESLKSSASDPLGRSGVFGYTNKRGLRTVSECSDGDISSQPVTCRISGRNRPVHIISQLAKRRSQPCYIYLSRIDDNDDFVLCYNWRVEKGKNIYRIEDLMQRLRAAQSELYSLTQLSHDNLLPFIGMACESQESHISIHLIQEYIGQGVSLQYFIEHNIPLSEPFLKHVGTDVLSALNYLHTKDVVHRNLRDSCLFIDANMNRIRLADFGIELRCTEAVIDYLGTEIHFAYPKPPGKSGKKIDIYRLGLVMLSLCQGYRVHQTTPPIPDSIGSSFSNFLSKCLEINELQRWSADKLIKHRFIDPSSEERNSQDDQSFSVDEKEAAREVGANPAWSPKRAGNSRFHEEYERLELLGHGGFGRVYKVRHKMVGKLYAIKVIPMERPNKTQWEKMTAEVRLLSSLNHENVVRYYTSWVEVVDTNIHEEDESTITDEPTTERSRLFEEESSNESDAELSALEPDDDWMADIPRFEPNDSDGSDVLFYDSQAPEEDDEEESSEKQESALISRPATTPISRKCSILYIQMDFCEKNTLRQAIDQGLHLDETRHWRLFRELINGIDYIHGRGLIHRDLKPGNIFLDSEDHVKIGDFGLAKVDLKAKLQTPLVLEEMGGAEHKESSSMTSQVGTTFYIAPEVNSGVLKGYTRKVDMYSLGIIFFEMLYFFSTGQERAIVLTSLRKQPAEMPSNIDEIMSEDKKQIILNLLVHDPSKRPSASDLLKSQLLPPPTEEHKKFMGTLQETIENVQSTHFKDLLDLIFQRSSRPELEASFDLAQAKSKPRQIWLNDYVRSLVTSIFKSHGGVCIQTPFFTPKNSSYDHKEGVPHFMSKGGELVCAQYELHYPFARWLAKKDTKRLRRYNIDRVQREFKTLGVHPSEFYQCAFDIVEKKTEAQEVTARVLLVAQEVIEKVTNLDSLQVMIQICHQKLTRMILKHCRIQPSLHNDVITLLKNIQTSEDAGRSLRDLLKGNKRGYNELSEFFDIKGSVEEVFSRLRERFETVKGEKENKQCVETVENEIFSVLKAAKLMGVKFKIFFDPMMVLEPNFFSGISFQFIRENNSLRHKSSILAKGGAYEDVVCQHKEKTFAYTKVNDLGICVVGVSLPLYHLTAHMRDNNNLTDLIESLDKSTSDFENLADVFICALDERQLEERLRLADDIREKGISVDHGYFSTRIEADELVEDLWYLSYVVYLYPNEDTVLIKSVPRVSSNGKPSVRRKVSHNQVVDHLSKLLSKAPQASQERAPLKREISRSSSVHSSIHVEFVTKKVLKDKDEKAQRTKIEEAYSHMSHRYSGLSLTHSVEVLAVDLDRKDMLMLGLLDVESTLKNFNESVIELKLKFSEAKDYVEKLCSYVRKKLFNKQKKTDKPVVILMYSIPSETFKRI